MSPQTSNEPSLEEILSSIRRIISEDGPATAQSALNARDSWPMNVESEGPEAVEEDVLVLTERVPMNGQPFLHAEASNLYAEGPNLEAVAPAEVPAAIIPSRETVPAPPIEVEPAAEAQSARPMEAPVMVKPEVQPVVAEDTEAETVAAFEKLDAVTHASETSARSLLMPAPGRTLEDVIRELMQPMLKEWLDENLPAIVQARVDEEIERISKRRIR